jgi:hypothetical protein
MSQTQIGFIILALAAGALIALALWIAVRRRATPEKREQRRRLQLHATGRLGDALVTETEGNLLYYSYSIRGVQYTASQDVSALRGTAEWNGSRLPEDLSRLIGPCGMKYVSNNPANSILLCEEWSGLRIPARVAVGRDASVAADPESQRTVTL